MPQAAATRSLDTDVRTVSGQVFDVATRPSTRLVAPEPSRAPSPPAEAWFRGEGETVFSGATTLAAPQELYAFRLEAASATRERFEVLVPGVVALAKRPPEPALPEYRRRQLAAIDLLNEWLADDSGYDERTWPELKRAIERDRTSYRRRFSG